MVSRLTKPFSFFSAGAVVQHIYYPDRSKPSGEIVYMSRSHPVPRALVFGGKPKAGARHPGACDTLWGLVYQAITTRVLIVHVHVHH